MIIDVSDHIYLIPKGMGVPMGDMKGVLDSEAEPNVAALEISDPEPLGCCWRPPPLPGTRST